MHTDRLERLIEILESVPESKFDIRAWGRYRYRDEPPECGTAFCALGWAGLDPGFQKLGLQLRTDNFAGWPILSVADFAKRLDDDPAVQLRPWFEDVSDFRAGAIFFGISNVQSEYIFSPLGLAIKELVIQRIRNVIEGTDLDEG